MINWNNYFDHIFIISRCINFERRQNIEKQLKKVNIINYSYWYVPDYNINNSLIFNDILLDIVPEPNFRASLGHYTLWKTCYDLNYNNILIIEDDEKFIDNLEEIENQLKIYKENKSDIYLFDWFFACKDQNYKYYNFSSCYMVNHFGLEYLIYMHEQYGFVVDTYFFDFSKNIKLLNSYVFHHPDYDKNIILDNKYLNINLMISKVRIAYQEDKYYYNPFFPNDN